MNDLSIIIAHFNPKDLIENNPIVKTLEAISKQVVGNIEIIIADDGSDYSSHIINDYSEKIKIMDDKRDVYILQSKKLEFFLSKINIDNKLISKWVYIPKYIKCMSKARVLNYAAGISKSKNLFFLDDDNYFISSNSI